MVGMKWLDVVIKVYELGSEIVPRSQYCPNILKIRLGVGKGNFSRKRLNVSYSEVLRMSKSTFFSEEIKNYLAEPIAKR